MARARSFQQVDVFTDTALLGNPLAVVIDAEGLEDAQLAAFARWTNLSETTFLLPPTDPAADYRVRIFTPSGELPFAGHPTLGSCHVWLDSVGTPADPDIIVQECGAGLIRIRRDGDRLAFAAPPRLRTGPLAPDLLARVVQVLGISAADVIAHEHGENGPPWLCVLLDSAEQVLELHPTVAGESDLDIGVVGPHAAGAGAAYEVRAFVVAGGALYEDPVTGSLNAALAQWLIGSGRAPRTYVAAQGTALDRAGRVFVSAEGEDVWIGGSVTGCVSGTVTL